MNQKPVHYTSWHQDRAARSERRTTSQLKQQLGLSPIQAKRQLQRHKQIFRNRKSSPVGTKLITAVHVLGVHTASGQETVTTKPVFGNSLETPGESPGRTPSEAFEPKLGEKKNNTAVRVELNGSRPV